VIGRDNALAVYVLFLYVNISEAPYPLRNQCVEEATIIFYVTIRNAKYGIILKINIVIFKKAIPA